MKEAGPLSRAYHRLADSKVLLGQDPFIAQRPDNKNLLLIQSPGGRKLTIRQSATIDGMSKAPEKTIWKPDKSNEHRSGLWAPELHSFPGTEWQGKWYVPLAMSKGDSETEEIFVLESKSSDPLGQYELKNRLMPGRWRIDLTYLQHNGQLYGLYSGKDSDDAPQDILIAPMTNPWTLIHEVAQRLSTPEYLWETSRGFVNEGPQVRRKNGKTQIIFSANGSWTTEYVMGAIDFTGNDVMDPASWRKRPAPVYKKNHGHGHTFDLENGEEVLVAHKKIYEDDGWEREIVHSPVSMTTLDQHPSFAKPIDIASFAPAPQPVAAGFSQVA